MTHQGTNRFRPSQLTRIGVVMVTLGLGLAGCGWSNAPSAPSAPTLPSAIGPVAQPTGLQPTITGVSPNVVSPTGTWGTITGTQFQPGATVKIGDSAVTGFFRDSTTIQFSRSGAHAVGSVDVTVTNPGGFAATLREGYRYASPESFDANGEWIAHADGWNDFMTDMRFTVRNDALVSLSCGTPVLLSMPIPLSRQNGTFTAGATDGLTISGTLASTTTSYGRVNAPGCGDVDWWADKSSAAPPPG